MQKTYRGIGRSALGRRKRYQKVQLCQMPPKTKRPDEVQEPRLRSSQTIYHYRSSKRQIPLLSWQGHLVSRNSQAVHRLSNSFRIWNHAQNRWVRKSNRIICGCLLYVCRTMDIQKILQDMARCDRLRGKSH